MATGSFSPELAKQHHSHNHHHHHRRDSGSSNKSLSTRRPRLLRSYATEPSITTENACKGLLTSQTYSSRRAAELLSRVAVSSSCSGSPTSTSSSRSSVSESERSTETNHTSCSYPPSPLLPASVFATKVYTTETDIPLGKDSACYFSFPSFDTWDEERRHDEEKTLERRS
ncbi:hypothetical protein F4808DRAFT_228214 [Astrocystis sublimbata]|nr:hypothetical protein F4808DRAFT_228214 [Astrocystis sublimbata]